MENRRDTNVEITRNFININKVFKDKAPKFYPFIPGFLLGYLKRIVHQEEVNRIIYANRDKWGLDFAQALIDLFKVNIIPHGLGNIPEKGKCLIASNHPLGGLDGISLINIVSRVRKDLLFPVNDIIMNIPNLKELFIPVNKHGSNSENIRLFNETFDSDILILYFPAGLVSRKKKGVIRDVEWKKTFLTKARKSGRDILPAYISGRNSNFFYNLANFRKWIGIGANLEMLYLVDESFRLKDKNINMFFSKPVSYKFFDSRQKDIEWAALIREYIYQLPEGENRSFDQWYTETK